MGSLIGNSVIGEHTLIGDGSLVRKNKIGAKEEIKEKAMTMGKPIRNI